VCNRTGSEPDTSGQSPGITFWGSSFVAGPQGEILAQAADDKATVLTVELDLGRTEIVRRAWPFLRDRRIDAYQNITRRFAD
jgi:N-carbamoylputrescine amidase